MRCVAFSCRPLDFGNLRMRDLAGRVLRRVRAGDIVLLHDALPAGRSVEGWLGEVRKILAGLEEKGLQPVKLSELIGEKVMEAGAWPVARRGIGIERRSAESAIGVGIGIRRRVGIGAAPLDAPLRAPLRGLHRSPTRCSSPRASRSSVRAPRPWCCSGVHVC